MVPPIEYLLHASFITLQDLELAALNRSSNLRKVVHRDLDVWIEHQVTAIVVRWFMENREELRQFAEDKGPMLPFKEFSQ